jgi:hypothetical protein
MKKKVCSVYLIKSVKGCAAYDHASALTSMIVCQLCEGRVRLDRRRIVGCLCDPDAPTWVGIEPNGRVLAFSQSKYEIVNIAPEEHTYD